MSQIKKDYQLLSDKIKSKGCSAFARLLTYKGKKFEPYSYQDKLFQYDFTRPQTRVCLQAARQVGKSIGAAIAIIFSAITSDFSDYYIISRTRDQASIIYSYIVDFIRENSWLTIFVDAVYSRVKRLVFKNGATITSKTVGVEARNVRGFHLTSGAVVYDEAAYISSTSISAIQAMTHNAATLMVSSPRYKSGSFYDCCTNPELGYDVIKVAMMDCPHIPKFKIDEYKKSWSMGTYQNDVLGNFSQGENNVFDPADIENGIDDTLPLFFDGCTFTGDPDKNYLWSMDVSMLGHDAWTLMIGDLDKNENVLSVVAYHNWHSKSQKELKWNSTYVDSEVAIIEQLLEYRKTFKPVKFYIDATSNPFVASHLLQKYLFPVEPVKWSLQKKEYLMENLNTCLRARKIRIPEDEELLDELYNYSYEPVERETDGEIVNRYRAGTDDKTSCLAMLCQSIPIDSHVQSLDYIEAW